MSVLLCKQAKPHSVLDVLFCGLNEGLGTLVWNCIQLKDLVHLAQVFRDVDVDEQFVQIITEIHTSL